ncbi:Nitroreductase-like protein [Aspergillus pseudonomiae]|uniref:Nitroreductase-like protein n=1 Tax=Aspergillus pseudonomiae TaxID=1506151 RepID=A0A5N6IHX9_9EURO|nr:Nitroreductase-like protein [Aspergillus pseudonomiae]KAB8266035.1 Nitroreductase-like protein [Aspergillus pseudonomiae]KAE8408901.1 Nitroreductase-like protein [Aspergillus pseudonomiae]
MGDCLESNPAKAALEARYLGSSPPEPTNTNPVLNAIWHHKSSRHFLPDPLPSGTLETLISAAQSVSTSSMLQVWSAVAVQDPTRKAAAAKLCGNQGFIEQAPLMLFFCADLNRLANISAWENQPGKALTNMDMFLMATIDTSLAAQNAALAAESMGLGICYVGGARNNAAQLCELLHLPHRTIALFGMAVGVPDPGRLVDIKPRLPLREVLHLETWDDSCQRENVERYNRGLSDFYDWHRLFGRVSWATFVAGLMAEGGLDGRERMRQVLLEKGFGLE